MDITLTKDNSIKTPDASFEPFEWATPVFDFKPSMVLKLKEFFTSILPKLGVETNSSCGLHFHVSFPNMNKMDATWAVLVLVSNKKLQDEFTNLGDIPFFNKKYAKKTYLAEFLRAFKGLMAAGDTSLLPLLDQSRYRVFNISAHKTVEWRGPRDFLNKPDLATIRKFTIHLFRVVQWITRAIQAPVLGKTKQEFIKVVEANKQHLDSKWKPNVKPNPFGDLDNETVKAVLKLYLTLLAKGNSFNYIETTSADIKDSSFLHYYKKANKRAYRVSLHY